MPYEFGPRDLDDPRVERDATRPDDDLADAFEEWLDRRESVARREIGGAVSGERYALAERTLSGVDVSAPAATTLLYSHRDRIPADVGLFLSAAYEVADEAVVRFDVESPVPVKHLGFRLGAGKALVLDAPVHSTMAVEGSGLVVNRARVESYLGYGSGAAFVNLGSCLTFGTDGPALAVNLGEVRGETGASTPVVSVALPGGERATVAPGDADEVDGLRDYLDRLARGLDGDPDDVAAFLDELAPSPARRLREDPAGIVGSDRAGESTGREPPDESTDGESAGESTDGESASESTDGESASESTDGESAGESTDPEDGGDSTGRESTNREPHG